MKRQADKSQDINISKSIRLDFSDTDEELLIQAVDEIDKQRKHVCDLCGKVLKTVKTLNQHKQAHMIKFTCDLCEKTFTRRDKLNMHKKKEHGIVKPPNPKSFVCLTCDKTFSSYSNRKKHQRNVHKEKSLVKDFQCKHCSELFLNYADLFHHVDQIHPLNQSGGRRPSSSTASTPSNIAAQLNEVKHRPATVQHKDDAAIQNSVQNRNILPKGREKYDLLTFLVGIKDTVVEYLLSRVQGRRGGIKWNICVQVEMERDSGDGVLIRDSPFFRSRTYMLLNVDTFNEHDLNEALQKIHASMESYLRRGSGWYVKKIVQLEIHTVIYSPLSGSSYIRLPKSLAVGHSILNINNYDDKCFLFSILASLHPSQNNPECVDHYIPFEKELNMTEIRYPVSLSQIDKFEKNNLNISVNIFGFENEEIFPLKITRNPQRLHHVNLLLLTSGEKSHFCLITNLNSFLSRTKGYKGSLHYCPYCLHGFTKEKLLQDHLPYCSVHNAQKVELPIPGQTDTLKFKEYEKTLKVPFVIYADFETLNVRLQTCDQSSNLSSTTPKAKLEVCGFGYKVVCSNPEYTKPTVVYRGKDASSKLIECLLEEMKTIQNILKQIQPMQLTVQDLVEVNNPHSCCICKERFTPYYIMYNKPVRHHNHLTGVFIGMAHNHCNINCQQVNHIPVIFHNLKNFDAHILCQNIGQFKERKLTCIAQNSERYISFSLGDLRFIDSFQFLPSSLETLIDNLAQDGLNAFPHTFSEFLLYEQVKLLLRKGIYPYDYMDSVDKFEETALPTKDHFYSEIKREGVSEEDYAHAQKVFDHFELQNLGQYHDLYLKTDVVLLSDVFEAFRDVCMDQYQLDPAHFYTSPGLSWAACLKMTGVQLELITDIDQILFIERGIRGGISQISHRHKRANNPYLKDFDPTQPVSYLQYLDMNNLYGFAMIQKLPVNSFRFLNKRELKHFNLYEVSEDDDVGYILEVSLRYPPQFHNDHNDYPLAPESKFIPNDRLSPYAQTLWKKLHGLTMEDELPQRPCTEKLLTTLEDKDRYIVHYRNLQLYLDLGMEIKEIHRILQFQQKAWMKSYIDFNTEMRKKAISTFQKNFYKLMNCSVFGKTMENIRKHKNIELVHTETRLRKLAAKPTYKTSTIFTEDLVAVELSRPKVKLFKPSYSGMCILDLSKLAMYDFYYNHLKQKYGNKLQLQMTDTDSLLFYCETEDLYKDMGENLNLYDTSDYPSDHILHSELNKKVLGKMKDETNGMPITEFVGLRSKMYSFRCGDNEPKRAKGISKVTVNKDLRFSHYKDVLFNETRKNCTMTSLQSRHHQLFCNKIVKTGLSAFDDKRYLLNALDSLAYGHYLLNNGNVTLVYDYRSAYE